jgi:hypothetical protein
VPGLLPWQLLLMQRLLHCARVGLYQCRCQLARKRLQLRMPQRLR